MVYPTPLLVAPVVVAGLITVDPVSAVGVIAGLVLTILGIRSYLSNIWRSEAEGYEKALARQREDYERQVGSMNARISTLARRIEAQDEEIARLQKETNVVPLFEMSREIKQIAESTQTLLDGRTALISRMNDAIVQMTSAEAQRPALEAIAQIHHLVEETDQRYQENSELFSKLYKEIFPMIARIYAEIVEGGAKP